jgi:hypothetical protein
MVEAGVDTDPVNEFAAVGGKANDPIAQFAAGLLA